MQGLSQKSGKKTAPTQTKEGCTFIYRLGLCFIPQLQPKTKSLREKPIFAL